MDTIVITKENGEKETMEVVSIFEKSDSPFHYIIYKNKEDYFIGKYIGENVCNLRTDLDETELNYSNKIFSVMVGE